MNGSVVVLRRITIGLLLLIVGSSANARHPLEPADTSSPRATMQSFLALTDEAADRFHRFRDAPSPESHRALRQVGIDIGRLFDLSQIPPAARRERSVESYVLLWDVTARLELPPLEEIPEADAFLEGDDSGARLAQWQIPGTEIVITRIQEGPRYGEFLFSADTVRRLPAFQEAVRELRYRRPMPSENLLRTNQLLTGWMIPLAWVEALPDWSMIPLLGQVLWKWMAVLVLAGLALCVPITLYLWARRREWGGTVSAYARRASAPLSALLLAMLLRYLYQVQINLTGDVASLPDYVITVVYGIAAVWLLWLTASWIAEVIIASPRIHPDSLDANILRLAGRAVGITASLVLTFKAAHFVGIPVYGLVAGAGVGGLAVALAARSTLENFVAALNLFADHPVRVGDLCRYDGEATSGWNPVGRVESIGLRSTKVRKLDRTLITIPNAEFAQLHIMNFDACDRMLLQTTLSLRYETTDDQLRYVLAEVRKLLHAHPKTLHTVADPIRVRFVGFGEYSLNVAVRVYISATDYNVFLGMQEDILLRIMKIVKEAGSGIAFPSRTLYLGEDRGLDVERQRSAENQVREWSSAGELPFPDFTEDYRRQITNSLDYPPEGSPGADR